MIKTAVAVFICLLIYILRGYQGMVIQSTIAAIICMQPYTSASRTVAKNRIISTVMGGIWGLLFLLLMERAPVLAGNMVVVYLIMSLGVIAVFYVCVLLHLTDSATLAAIVFLCIIITYPNVETPVRQTVYRITDTIIGVCVAVVVNSLRLPKKKHPEKIFFLRLRDIAADRFSLVPSRVMIELNRLYDEGARIVLETRWAPAFLISQMSALRINMPVIVMDGAALYDIRENRYYTLMSIDHDLADQLMDRLSAAGRCICVFAVRTHTMLIFHKGEMSGAELQDYEKLRRTPYRNYMDGMYEKNDNIVAIRFIVKDGAADAALSEVLKDSWITEHFRVAHYSMPRTGGQTGIYFYHPDASMENMEARLIDHLRSQGETDLEDIHIIPMGKSFDPEYDAHLLLQQISRQYMTLRP